MGYNDALTDLAFLEFLPTLEKLVMNEMDGIQDYSPLSHLTSLQHLTMGSNADNDFSDLTIIQDRQPKLIVVDLYPDFMKVRAFGHGDQARLNLLGAFRRGAIQKIKPGDRIVRRRMIRLFDDLADLPVFVKSHHPNQTHPTQ